MHVFLRACVCVCVCVCACHQSDPLRSVNVAHVLELQMQMTASSIFPNAQLERRFKASLFTSVHLLRRSQAHARHCGSVRGVSGGNDEQLTCIKSFHLFPSRRRRASFSRRKATTLTWFIYLFSRLVLLWCLFFPYFVWVCECVLARVCACVCLIPLSSGASKHSALLGAFKKSPWRAVRWSIFTLTPNKTLLEPWWMVLTSHCRGWRQCERARVRACVHPHKRPFAAAWQGHWSWPVIGQHRSGCVWLCLSVWCNTLCLSVNMCTRVLRALFAFAGKVHWSSHDFRVKSSFIFREVDTFTVE